MKITIIKTITLLCLLVFTVGCSTVTIHPDRLAKVGSKADFDESRDFFFWGLYGKHKVDVTKICGTNNVRQMQTQMTFENALFYVVTFGIYAPHTIRVWCGSNSKVNS